MDEFPVGLGRGEEVIVFDIGGTWFRCGLLTRAGRLTSVQRTPSINCRLLPGISGEDIVDKIAGYIAETTKSFWRAAPLTGRAPSVAISLGAALNAHTGRILGSGPILGEDNRSFDLEIAIRRHLDGSRITIVNDVTASLLAHSRLRSLRHARRLALITVSTGIASRILNCSVPHIPVCPAIGIQGEIGHHSVAFSLGGKPLSLRCACGGVDHINAFASGQGIKCILDRAREIFPEEFCTSHLNCSDGSDVFLQFGDGLAQGDALCHKLLNAVTAPVAEAIKWHFMLDPEIDKLILTGGVCFSLRDFYFKSVLENLRALDFYPLTSDVSSFWAERVMLGPISGDAGMLGAACVARESLNLHRREALDPEPPYRISRQSVVEYSIHLAEDILEDGSFPEHLLDPFERIILVADAKLDEMYGHEIRRLLTNPHRRVDTVVLRTSEKQKDLFAVAEVVSAFENLGVRRRKDLIVAAGGGITLDIVAFASNIFRRGVPCLRIPTTLLAQIDAGIGVKNAVNFRQSKSRLGTFAAPYAVVVDPCFLRTLSDRQIRNGLSEALKIALVADRALFELIEEHVFYLVRTKLQCMEGADLIRRAIRAMLLELSPNLYEKTLERFPDYGHTFSPIFEFELSDLEHGEAVALDMALSTGLAVVLDILDIEDAHRILATQHALGLPIVRSGVTTEMLLRGVQEAKKHRGGELRMPVLGGIGEALFLDEVTEAQLQEALSFVYSYSSGRMAEIRSAYGRTPEVKSA